MGNKVQQNFAIRKNFAEIKSLLELPNLIDIQRTSWDKFLQADTEPEKRTNVGLQGVFKSVFPIKDYNETASLEFVSYTLDKPKYDVDECRSRGMTFAAPIKVVVQLVLWDRDEISGIQTIRNVKQQEVYFGEIPLMTEQGTFIINGTERVVVSQLHRSPGVSLTVTEAEPIPPANYYLTHESFLTVVLGLISRSTIRILFIVESTVAANFRQPFS